MRYRYFAITTAAFLTVLLTGGVWIAVARGLDAGESPVWVVVLGGLFSAVFIWLLITRLRSLLAYPRRRWLELGLLALNVAILILAFAWVYHDVGLMDHTEMEARPTGDFGDAVYFSIVTSTTLGSGDFLPTEAARPIAALQALVGYLILGILVSTGFHVIAPHTHPAEAAREQAEE